MIMLDFKGFHMEFETNEHVFSPNDLDTGTLAMLSFVTFHENDKVLDLGCGYGLVGILAAKQIGVEQVVLSDVSIEALELSRKNAINNNLQNMRFINSFGMDSIEDSDFTLILSNPPYHVDFSVPKNFIEKGYQKLLFGGKMYMVTKRKDWYKNKFISVFGGVKIEEKDGYYIFMAEKKQRRQNINHNVEKKMSKKLMRKYHRYQNKEYISLNLGIYNIAVSYCI